MTVWKPALAAIVLLVAACGPSPAPAPARGSAKPADDLKRFAKLDRFLRVLEVGSTPEVDQALDDLNRVEQTLKGDAVTAVTQAVLGLVLPDAAMAGAGQGDLAAAVAAAGGTYTRDEATGALLSVTGGGTVLTFEHERTTTARGLAATIAKSPDGTTGTVRVEIAASRWKPVTTTLAGAIETAVGLRGAADLHVFGGEVPDVLTLEAIRLSGDLVPTGDAKRRIKVEASVDDAWHSQDRRWHVMFHRSLDISAPSARLRLESGPAIDGKRLTVKTAMAAGYDPAKADASMLGEGAIESIRAGGTERLEFVLDQLGGGRGNRLELRQVGKEGFWVRMATSPPEQRGGKYVASLTDLETGATFARVPRGAPGSDPEPGEPVSQVALELAGGTTREVALKPGGKLDQVMLFAWYPMVFLVLDPPAP